MTGGDTVAWNDRLLPTTTVHQARLQLFQPTRHPVFCTRAMETPWGTAHVTGRLGQMHALLLEALLFHAQKKRVLEEGSVQILVDPYILRTTLSRADGGYSGKGMKTLAQDLRASAITLDIPKLGVDGFVLDGLLNEITPSSATVPNPVTGEMRPLWRVTLTKTLAVLLDRDLPLHYDPRPLAALRTGTAAAVARWILTHRDCPQGGWHIGTVLAAVGAETTGGSGRNRRREVRTDRAVLAELGIVINEDRIQRGGVYRTPGGVLSTPGACTVRQAACSLRQGR